MREILVHLNVSVPDDDQRTANQVATWIEKALDRGLDAGRVKISPPSHMIVVALAEEV